MCIEVGAGDCDGACLTFSTWAPAQTAATPDFPPAVCEIGSRLEPLIDGYLIGRLQGLEHRLHSPQPAPATERAPTGYYATVIEDGETFRYYHRGVIPGYTGSGRDGNPGEITCCEESSDGISWAKPSLDFGKIDGLSPNNAVLAHAAPFSHNFSPFLDRRPDVPPNQRSKAPAGVHQSGPW